MSHSKTFYKKPWFWITAGILIILIVARLLLPGFLLRFVNDKLADLDGYHGHVKDIDVCLIRGAYVIDSVDFVKTSDSIPVPFISIESVDISVHWKALINGEIVSEIMLQNPHLNFAVAESAESKGGTVEQTGDDVNWVETMKEITPFRINRFEVINGRISYRDFTSEPKIDIAIEKLDLLATNLSNVQHEDERLPSTVEATGNVFGSGNFQLEAKLNVLREMPDLDMNFKIEKVEMVNLNDFLRAYSNTDVEDGVFNLYTEIAVDNKQITGYVKPVMEHIKLLKWKQEKEGFFGKVWEGIVGGVVELFENQPKDRIATRVPLEHTISDVDPDVSRAIWNVFKNAFIDALSKSIEHKIEFSDTYDEES